MTSHLQKNTKASWPVHLMSFLLLETATIALVNSLQMSTHTKKATYTALASSLQVSIYTEKVTYTRFPQSGRLKTIQAVIVWSLWHLICEIIQEQTWQCASWKAHCRKHAGTSHNLSSKKPACTDLYGRDAHKYAHTQICRRSPSCGNGSIKCEMMRVINAFVDGSCICSTCGGFFCPIPHK